MGNGHTGIALSRCMHGAGMVVICVHLVVMTEGISQFQEEATSTRLDGAEQARSQTAGRLA